MKTYFISLFVIFYFGAFFCYAQGGSVDVTFGKGGIAVPFDERSAGIALWVLPDDKMLVVSTDFSMTKLLPDGQPDVSFGSNGKALSSFSVNSFDAAHATAVQPDGKILVAGEALAGIGNTDFAIARLNPGGSPDLSFNGTGNATFDITGYHDICYSVVLQPDGKIILAGQSSDDYSIIRLNNDGSLDLSFNGTGEVVTQMEGYGGEAHGLLLQADGKIVLAGDVNGGTATKNDIRLVRYKPNGIVDSSFGIYGFVTTDLFHTRESIKTAALLADGSILVAGLVETQNDNDFVLVKYRADGTPDSSFGTYGYSVADIENGSDDIAYGMTVQPDGRIILAGRTWPTTGTAQSLFSLARFTASGTLDTKFGIQGAILGPEITDNAGTDNWANAVALQSNGKIIAAGYAKLGASFDIRLALVRYHSDITAHVPVSPQKELQFVPNPAINTLFVHLGYQPRGVSYHILNSAGKLLLRGVLLHAESSIDISGLAPGNYFIQFFNAARILHTQSFVKQ